MLRVALFLFLILAALLALRLLRVFFSALAGPSRGRESRPEGEEMVQDPVCGTWIDRRLALAGRRGGEWIPVCSEKCRAALGSPVP